MPHTQHLGFPDLSWQKRKQLSQEIELGNCKDTAARTMEAAGAASMRGIFPGEKHNAIGTDTPGTPESSTIKYGKFQLDTRKSLFIVK